MAWTLQKFLLTCSSWPDQAKNRTQCLKAARLLLRSEWRNENVNSPFIRFFLTAKKSKFYKTQFKCCFPLRRSVICTRLNVTFEVNPAETNTTYVYSNARSTIACPPPHPSHLALWAFSPGIPQSPPVQFFYPTAGCHLITVCRWDLLKKSLQVGGRSVTGYCYTIQSVLPRTCWANYEKKPTINRIQCKRERKLQHTNQSVRRHWWVNNRVKRRELWE